MKISTIKQSTLSNVMSGLSGFFAVAIFGAAIITSQMFAGVTSLSNVQMDISTDLRLLVTAANYNKDMVRSFSQEGNEIFLDMYNKAQTGDRTTTAIVTTLKTLINEPKGQEQLAAVVAQLDKMAVIEKQVLELIKNNQLEEAQRIAFGQSYGVAVDGVTTAINELEQGMERGIGAIVQGQSDRITFLGVIIAVLCVLLALVQLANALITRNLIIAPLIKLKDSMVSMNEGHLSAEANVPINGSEIGALAEAMYAMRSRVNGYIQEITFILHCLSQKNMQVELKSQYVGDFAAISSSLTQIIDSLSDSFGRIGISTDGILSSAQQVAATASALAQGATIQASSVEELSASINEISHQLESTATGAETAKKLALVSETDLAISNQQMSELIGAISEISVSSSEISKIIKTIEDIAFQTNILALNAAVEAARAGSAGKGFAVVADEVRNLATKSSEAAKQTNSLIENSVQSVESGVRIADKTAQTLAGVVASSQAIAELIGEISKASTEQALSISQINVGVEQISAVVQTNSATSEESAATSLELSNQAQDMKELVSSFKIKTDV